MLELDDGRTLAQSNAIIRYLAAGSDLIPRTPLRPRRWTSGCSGSSTATSPISRCAASRWSISARRAGELDPEKVKRGYAALERMEQHLASSRFLAGEAVSLADVSLLAYTRVAHEGGFDLDGYAAVAPLDRRDREGARPANGEVSAMACCRLRRSPSAARAAMM